SITLGKLVGNVLKPMLDVVPAVTDSLEDLARTNTKLTTGILLTPIGLVGLGAGLLTTGFAASKLAGIIGFLATQLNSLTNLAISGVNKQLVAVNTLLNTF